MEGTNSNEALVLSDGEGNMYAIPREVLEQHKVTGAQKAQLDQLMGDDDVSGYSMYQYTINAARTQDYQDTARREAADARRVKAATAENAEAGGTGGGAEEFSAPSGTFFGKFVSMFGITKPQTS